MPAFVYILKCSDGTLYTGWTTNLEKRVKLHNDGNAAKYTRARLPVEVVYWEALSRKDEAMKRECEIKRLTRREKLQLCAAAQGEEGEQ